MPDLYTLQVENHDGKRVHLSWADRGDVIIERSRQRSGNFTEIATVIQGTQYIDTLPAKRNSRDEYYYRIRRDDITLSTEDGEPIVDDDGDYIQTSDSIDRDREVLGPKKAEPPVDARVAYVRREAERHLRRVGEESFLFEESTGERCPECWDEVRRVRERSECDNCDGSGYINGWSDPISFRMSYGAGEPEPKQTQGGELSTLQLQCWTAAIPEIDVGDHIVRGHDREVFRVVKRQPTKKGSHDLRQNVIVKLVEHGSEARSVAEELSA